MRSVIDADGRGDRFGTGGVDPDIVGWCLHLEVGREKLGGLAELGVGVRLFVVAFAFSGVV